MSRTSPTSGCRNRARTPPVFRSPGSRRVRISSTREAQARTTSRSSSQWCWPKPRTFGAHLLPQYGARYSDPKLVLFSGGVRSACGIGMAQMGPFYCPQDEKVYIDLSFYKELKDRFNAPGDAAQAYVIAHEVGHHVQKLLGIMDQVEAVRQRVSERQGNAIQVRVELQADCFAGVWANKTQEAKKIFEPGDIESALNAASAIGDDRIQKQTQGYVVPDSFTHGSSEQRVRWFKRGYQTGDLRQCDTFNADDL